MYVDYTNARIVVELRGSVEKLEFTPLTGSFDFNLEMSYFANF